MRHVLWVTALCVIGMGLMTACKSTVPSGGRTADDGPGSELPGDGSDETPLDDDSDTPGDDMGDDDTDPGDGGSGDDDDSDPGDDTSGDDDDADPVAGDDDDLPPGGGGDDDDDDDETTAGIVPGAGIPGITLGVTNRTQVEASLGQPDSSVADSVLYELQGIIVWYDESDVVRRLLLEAPYAGETAGGNGIGSSIAAFRNEFGSDDVSDASDNFRVWTNDGLAVDFTNDIAERIEILPLP